MAILGRDAKGRFAPAPTVGVYVRAATSSNSPRDLSAVLAEEVGPETEKLLVEKVYAKSPEKKESPEKKAPPKLNRYQFRLPFPEQLIELMNDLNNMGLVTMIDVKDRAIFWEVEAESEFELGRMCRGCEETFQDIGWPNDFTLSRPMKVKDGF